MKTNRWAAAGWLDAKLPQVRGRDRLLSLVRGRRVPVELREVVRVSFGPGFHADVNPSADGSLEALYRCQWIEPALMPVLESALTSGDTFVDIGSNIGIYSMYASARVGSSGRVISFEPVPDTFEQMRELLDANAITNVELHRLAIGESTGELELSVVSGASGLASARVRRGAQVVTAHQMPLDDALVGDCPRLIKIDVEGAELAVLRGARRTLTDARPAVLFEAPGHGGVDSGETRRCVDLLCGLGYGVHSLTTRGLKTFDHRRHTHNLLAVPNGSDIPEKLRRTKFPRNQNT